jgi:hypothetical protein
MPTLAEVQRRLWRLIRAPDGVAAALAAAGDADGRELATWIVDDERLACARRLEVYANAYFHRIHGCLARDFGALAGALGDAGFHDLVTAYLIAHPSRHPSLRWAGAALADYLANASPALPFRSRWPWAADLARLEWALGCAFDATDAQPLTRDALAKEATGAWDDLALGFHPSVHLVETAWPVDEMLEAWRADQPVSAPAALQPTRIAVWRRDESVRHRTLDALEARLLTAALAGESFGELCARAAASRGPERAPALAAESLGRWVDDGLLVATRTG